LFVVGRPEDRVPTRLDFLNGMPYTDAMKKVNPLDGLLRLRGRFVLNQKAQVFADKRSKRNKTRAEQKRRALNEQE
jgi:hypothetical protein